jgi:putative hydrolase of the HAD superfamily
LQNFVLVLDAMGVIYESADDVSELLVPFVSECGGISDVAAIQREYIAASLGKISAARFWKHIGVSPTLEDVYLARHRLRDGCDGFLRTLPSKLSRCGVYQMICRNGPES